MTNERKKDLETEMAKLQRICEAKDIVPVALIGSKEFDGNGKCGIASFLLRGTTKQELEKNFKIALVGLLNYANERGIEIPEILAN